MRSSLNPPRYGRPIADRFWEKVVKEPNSGCWLWTAAVDNDGYGNLALGTGCRLAHRVSWELHNGPIPTGLHVLHKCDTPPCVNPAHLFLGTHADNMADAISKGRRGPRWTPKLTQETVIEIRQRMSNGDTQAAIAAHYGVAQPTISNIKTGRTWIAIRNENRP